MANATVRRPGFVAPKNTNVTGPETIVEGPFTTPASDTVYTGMAVTVNSSGVLAACAAKSKPFGIVQLRNDYDWGTTRPGFYVLLPQSIDVFVIVKGRCLAAMDKSQNADSTVKGATVFATLTAGLLCASNALVSGEAGDYACGTLEDIIAGNTGTGTGGADGDPMEIDFQPMPTVLSTS